MSKRHKHSGMSGRYRPYPTYGDCGVEWAPSIPNGWTAEKAKRLFQEVVDRNHPHERLLSVTQMNGVLPREESDLRVWNPGDDLSGYKLVLPDDFVISLRSFQGGIEHCSCRGIISPAYTVLRPLADFNRGFFRHLLKSYPVVSALNSITTGIRQGKNISYDDFAQLTCLLPPKDEQRTIAAFLDRETAKIDALVAKKERLIELLQEKRTALITHAVTKGLDPNVPMKDSGVEWLGQIPAHWECLALSRYTRSRCDGPFGSGLKSEHYSARGVRVIRLQNIGWAEFRDDDRAYIDPEYAHSLGDHTVKFGDILVAGLGDERHPVGRACVAREGLGDAMVKADCFRFRLCSELVNPRFLAFQLSASAEAAAGSMATGATRSRMNLTATSARKVAIPPLAEQRSIVVHLNRTSMETDALLTRVEEAIDRLKEYRTALISAAVTGKIDVREEVA